MLMDSERMYMVMAIPQPHADGADSVEPELVKTGRSKEIAGYTCEEVTVTTEDGVTTLWVTDRLGAFMSVGNPMQRGRASWESFADGEPFFPLEIQQTDRRGRVELLLTATAVDTSAPPASRFAPPEGYEKVEMPVMPGMGP
jgi:hypothetical protein